MITGPTMTGDPLSLSAASAKKKLLFDDSRHEMKSGLRRSGLNSVCEEARCPNIGECFSRRTATFLVMGRICTRNCAFCSIEAGKPGLPDPAEIDRLAGEIRERGLSYVVVTSVTRDDLQDAGASFLAAAADRLKRETEARIEFLFPDLGGKKELLDLLLPAGISVYGHNVEMVERLYPSLRSGADYATSLGVLSHFSSASKLAKTGFMVGLGETGEELKRLIADIAASGAGILTIGQYFQPTRRHAGVVKYYHQDEFDELRLTAGKAGIPVVASGPFVRSSYRAEDLFMLANGASASRRSNAGN